MRTKRRLTPPVELWVSLLRVHTLVARCAGSELAARGVTLARFDVIAELALEEACCSQGALCERLLVTKGQVSILVDRMVREGLLKRWTDPENRRCNRVSLTPRGRRVFEEIVPMRESCLERMFSKLSRRQQVELKDLLCKLLDSVKERAGLNTGR
jgi:DNA-binding MarR family transcriptional regulator